jgi:hypothetical protein
VSAVRVRLLPQKTPYTQRMRGFLLIGIANG